MSTSQPLNTLTSNSPIALENGCGYRIQGNRVVISIGQIMNHRTNNAVSGTLSIELWALKNAYTGGDFNGTALASTHIGEILDQHFLANCQYDLIFKEPQAGTWHLCLMLREWDGTGYVTRDYVNFATPYVANWVPSVIQGASNNVINVSFAGGEKPVAEKAPVDQKAPAVETAKAVVAPEVTIKPVEKAVATKAKKAPLQSAETLSVNSASLEEIAKLKGVSDHVAKAIVKNRPFASLDDLIKVKGVGKKLLANIRQYLSL